MLRELVCPQCGGKMEVDEAADKAVCVYCGCELKNFHQKIDINQNVNVSGHVTAKMDRSNEPNLIIDFSCEEPTGRMVIEFNNSKLKRIINNGQTVTMKLPLGRTIAIMDLAGKSYKREIWIVEHAPVRINASAFGRREIVIEQPDYEVPESEKQNAQKEKAPSDPAARPSGMSIAAFIASLTFFGSPVGLALGIVSLILAKQRKKVFSVLAIIFGAILTLSLIITITSWVTGGGTTTSSSL